jgi:hypothetical protein
VEVGESEKEKTHPSTQRGGLTQEVIIGEPAGKAIISGGNARESAIPEFRTSKTRDEDGATIMLGCNWIVKRRLALMLAAIVTPILALAADQGPSKTATKVAGILFDYDREAHWMTVKADREDEPVKYLIDPADKRLAEALKSVFNASRVQLTYRTDGDTRRLVSIKTNEIGQAVTRSNRSQRAES